MRWNQGRAHVDRLIEDGELQRVPANREHADQLLVQARKDLASAKLLLETNPKRAYESVWMHQVQSMKAAGSPAWKIVLNGPASPCRTHSRPAASGCPEPGGEVMQFAEHRGTACVGAVGTLARVVCGLA